MDISIEELSDKYLQDTIEVVTKAFGESWRKDAEIDFSASISPYPRPFTTLIALNDSKVVGAAQCIHANLSPDTYIIMWVGVDPAHQRKGIGTTIMKECCAHIEKNFLKGKRGTIILVSGVNPEYYNKLGFNQGHILHNDCPVMLKIVGEK